MKALQMRVQLHNRSPEELTTVHGCVIAQMEQFLEVEWQDGAITRHPIKKIESTPHSIVVKLMSGEWVNLLTPDVFERLRQGERE